MRLIRNAALHGCFALLAFAFPNTLHAQLPPACGGTTPAIACAEACISCNFNGFGNTTAGFPSSIAPEFCGTVENAQWLGFIAGAADATFTILPSNCSNGDGVQVALYDDCTMAPLACEKGEMGGAGMPVSINVPLTVGKNYYLLIDGYAGDQCDFSVSVTPADAVYQPPLDVVSILTGPTALCPGAQFDYQVQPVAGAAAYIWTGPPGTLFDSLPSPATILGNDGLEVTVTMGNTSGQICVQAANSCATNPPCSASLNVTVLDDSFRPQLVGDTLASLTCTDAPLSLNLSSTPLSNVQFSWTADSTGHIVSGANNLQPVVDSVGVYTLVARDKSNGCTSTTQVRVTPPVLPSAVSFATRDVGCFGFENGYFRVDSVSDGTPPYLYALDNQPFSAVDQFSTLAPGEYELHIQDAAGCEADTTFFIGEPNELLVVLAPDTSIELGRSLILWDTTDVNYPARVRTWRVTGIDSTGCAGCPVMPLRSFYFTVSVVDSNGCSATDQRSVFVTKERHVVLPNVFAPDATASEGNERFGVACGPDVERVNYLRVCDRWGQFVHERSNFAPNDQTATWDGRIGNRKAPPGVYAVVAEVLFKDGESVVFRGDLTVVR